MKQTSLLDGKIELLIPERLGYVQEEEFKKIYPSIAKKPSVVLINDAKNIELIIDYRPQYSMDNNAIDGPLDSQLEIFRKSFPQLKLLNREIKQVNKKNVGILEFIIPGKEYYEYFFMSDIDSKPFIFSLRFPKTQSESWVKAADKILQSLKIIGSYPRLGKAVDKIWISNDTVAVNEPFCIEAFVSAFPVNEYDKIIWTKGQLEKRMEYVFSEPRLSHSDLIIAPQSSISTTDSGVIIKYIAVAGRQGIIQIPDFKYKKNEESFTLKNKKIVVKNEVISSSDSLKIIDEMNPKDLFEVNPKNSVNFQAGKIELKLEKNIIHAKVDEKFYIQYITNCKDKNLNWSDPDLSNFEIVKLPGNEYSMEIIDGKPVEKTLKYYQLIGRTKGTFEVKPVVASCEEKRIESDVVTIIIE
ncbi:MAG: hypothetical protein KBF96_06810 [Ignavibacteria bacterium]|nr:hypothetical protein [Ignavibacteria bacterium]